eukprot:contig_13976_g3364
MSFGLHLYLLILPSAFAVHVRAKGASGVRRAVLLSVVHGRLGDASPWHDVAPVEHQRVRAFHLPQVSDFFIGRREALKKLTQKVREKGAAVVASTGLPGVGKSFLAIKWAHTQRQMGVYSVIAWLRAERIRDLEADLVTLGKWLGFITASAGQSRRNRALSITAHLEARPGVGTLLVFDNARSFQDLEEFVPKGDGCNSLFTARDSNLFPTSALLPLCPFTMKESLALLRVVSGMELDGASELHAMELCDEVGHLPLAVHFLATYAARSGLEFAEVLKRVQGKVMLARPLTVEGQLDYAGRKSVVGAVQLVLDQLDDANRASLNRLTMLAPDRVPQDALLRGAETDRLLDFSIVSYPDVGFISIHRLVQSVALGRMPRHVRKQVANELLDSMLEFTKDFSDANQESWEPVRVISTHAEALLRKMDVETRDESAERTSSSARWDLVERLRKYFIATAAFDPAALEAALRWSRFLMSEMSALLGPRHSGSISAVMTTAGVLESCGQFVEAEELYRAVERSNVESLGDDHPSVATTRRSIADLLVKTGKFDEALVLYQRVEKAEVAALGDDHPNVATTRDGTARLLVETGRLDEALMLYRAVERTQVAALGHGHSSVATTRLGIAGVLADMGKLDEALVLYRVVEE